MKLKKNIKLKEFTEKVFLMERTFSDDEFGGKKENWKKSERYIFAKIDHVLAHGISKTNFLANMQKNSVDIKCVYKITLKTKTNIKNIMAIDWKDNKLFLSTYPIRIGQYIQFYAVQLVEDKELVEELQ